ncbi:GNAT family N-acetyltransferase [Candidatus Woesebacteria bacterium]|nr:GNAT family N-acetyltransferase [Candidatus Woesebacteria bacterium]
MPGAMVELTPITTEIAFSITQHEFKDGEVTRKFCIATYSPISPESLEIISRAITALHTTEGSGSTPYYNATAQSVIASLKEASIVMIASTNLADYEQPIGYALLGPPCPQTDECREIGIMVGRDFRNKSVAKQMFLALLNQAQPLGVSTCRADFSTSNKSVWRLLRTAESAGLIYYVTKIDGSDTAAQIVVRTPQIA